MDVHSERRKMVLTRDEYTKLFEQFAVITFPAGAEKPIVAYSFEGLTIAPHVAQFCFPNRLAKRKPSKGDRKSRGESFVYVLTSAEGRKQYGFCLRVWGPRYRGALPQRSDGGGGSSSRDVDDVAEDVGARRRVSRVPTCYTIISFKPWFEFFSRVLRLVWREDHRSTAVDSPAYQRLLSTLSIHPIPAPGGDYRVRVARSGPDELHHPPHMGLKRPTEVEDHLIISDELYRVLLDTLHPIKIILLFTAMLSERRIIFFGDDISLVSACVHAAISLLYPLTWQHIFVPVLPPSLLEYCQAPMPFVVGVLTENMPTIRRMHLNEVVFVDLEKGRVTTQVADAALLPQQRVHSLRKTIQSALERRDEPTFRPAVVKVSFREFFLTMLGTYRRHMHASDEDDGRVKFNRKAFIRASTRSHRKFLRALLTSQMFERWITDREEWASGKAPPPLGIFEREVDLLDAQVSEAKRKRTNPTWNRLTGVVTAQRNRHLQRTPSTGGGTNIIRQSSAEDVRSQTLGSPIRRGPGQTQSMRFDKSPSSMQHDGDEYPEMMDFRDTSHHSEPMIRKRIVKMKVRVYRHPPFSFGVPFSSVHEAFSPERAGSFCFPEGVSEPKSTDDAAQESEGTHPAVEDTSMCSADDASLPALPAAPSSSQARNRRLQALDLHHSPGRGIESKPASVPPRGDYIPSRGDYIPSRGDYIPSRGDLIPSRGDLIPSRGDLIPSRGDLIPPRGDLLLPEAPKGRRAIRSSSSAIGKSPAFIPPRSDVAASKPGGEAIIDGADRFAGVASHFATNVTCVGTGDIAPVTLKQRAETPQSPPNPEVRDAHSSSPLLMDDGDDGSSRPSSSWVTFDGDDAEPVAFEDLLSTPSSRMGDSMDSNGSEDPPPSTAPPSSNEPTLLLPKPMPMPTSTNVAVQHQSVDLLTSFNVQTGEGLHEVLAPKRASHSSPMIMQCATTSIIDKKDDDDDDDDGVAPSNPVHIQGRTIYDDGVEVFASSSSEYSSSIAESDEDEFSSDDDTEGDDDSSQEGFLEIH